MRPDCRERIRRRPTSYLARLYFDTVVFTTHQLEYLVRQYGSQHLLMGTDYPFDMGMDDPVGFIESARRLTRDRKGRDPGPQRSAVAQDPHDGRDSPGCRAGR